MNEQDLQQRTKKFGLRVLKLVDALPKTASGRIIASQLGRSGTSVGSNYRAACHGRSRADFVAKLGIVEEEADESLYWLEVISEGGILKPTRVRALLQEAKEITAIVSASRITATRNGRSIANRKLQIENP
jgi:four helix bundle protein